MPQEYRRDTRYREKTTEPGAVDPGNDVFDDDRMDATSSGEIVSTFEPFHTVGT